MAPPTCAEIERDVLRLLDQVGVLPVDFMTDGEMAALDRLVATGQAMYSLRQRRWYSLADGERAALDRIVADAGGWS